MSQLSANQRAVVERQVAAGAEAEALLSQAAVICTQCGQGTSIFKEREEQIIKEACDWLVTRTDGKDDHIAVRFIARLAETRDLSQALGHRAKKAGEARALLYGSKTTAE